MSQPDLAAARQQLRSIFQAGLDAVHGTSCVAAWLARNPVTRPTSVIAIGKAACAMTGGASRVLGRQLLRGLLITRHGHLTHACRDDSRLTCIEAGHPLPDSRSLEAGAALCDFLDGLPPGAALLFLISGGASSLVEVLPPGVSLELLQRANRWLLGSGLDIAALNHIRQSLSGIKGGRLLERLRNRPALALLISDVPGDDPAVIGSGLLYPPADAAPPDPPLPDWLAPLVAAGRTRPVPGGQPVPHRIVASLDGALQAAAAHAAGLGLRTMRAEPRLAGDAQTTGEALAGKLLQQPPGICLWGGETTVRLPERPGTGGRNQQLALAAAGVLAGASDCVMLAAGTDGSDGSSQAAGAIVDGGSIARMRAAGFDPGCCLQQADAGSCLAASGDLLHTGPTGTNVMDMVIGLRLAGTVEAARAKPV